MDRSDFGARHIDDAEVFIIQYQIVGAHGQNGSVIDIPVKHGDLIGHQRIAWRDHESGHDDQWKADFYHAMTIVPDRQSRKLGFQRYALISPVIFYRILTTHHSLGIFVAMPRFGHPFPRGL